MTTQLAPNHDHSLCENPITEAWVLIKILSRWHYDFPRKDALAIVSGNQAVYDARGDKPGLAVAEDIIHAEATKTAKGR